MSPSKSEIEEISQSLLAIEQESGIETFLRTRGESVDPEETKSFIFSKYIIDAKRYLNQLSFFIENDLDAYLKTFDRKRKLQVQSPEKENFLNFFKSKWKKASSKSHKKRVKIKPQ